MRIAVDGSCWSNRRGFGRFTRGLVTELVRERGAHDVVLVMDSQSAAAATSLPVGAEVVTVPVRAAPSVAASADGARSLTDVMRMSFGARRAHADVCFFPATYSYFPVVGSRVVVTVHDAIAERLPDLVVPSRVDRWRWAAKQRLALRQARAVVTVSESARRDVQQLLHVPRDRITVIREAPDARFRPAPPGRAPDLGRFGLDGSARVVLYVGGISPHKNLPVLVEAFARVVASRADVHLLLVGAVDDDPFLSAGAAVRAAIARHGLEEHVTLTGFVDDDALVELYQAATVTVQPSLGEGFGLTVAESVACGTPVVASDLPALVELLGDAGTYVDPSSVDAIARGVGSLLDDPERRGELAERGGRLAREWSWTSGARRVLTLLEQVADA